MVNEYAVYWMIGIFLALAAFCSSGKKNQPR